jgi:hypothetical protein
MHGDPIRDRGNIKWTAMMLPEHRQKLIALMESENDVEKPELSEDQWEVIQYAMEESMRLGEPLTVLYYANKRYQRLTGSVQRIDLLNQTLELSKPEGVGKRLALGDIVDAYRA